MISTYSILGIFGFLALIGMGKKIEAELGMNSILSLIFIALIIFISFFKSFKIDDNVYFNIVGNILALYALILIMFRVKKRSKFLALFSFSIVMPLTFLLKYYIYDLTYLNPEVLLWILSFCLALTIFITTNSKVMAVAISILSPYVAEIVYYFVFPTYGTILDIGSMTSFQIMIVTTFTSLVFYNLVSGFEVVKSKKYLRSYAETSEEYTIDDKIIDRKRYPHLSDDDKKQKKNSKNTKKK